MLIDKLKAWEYYYEKLPLYMKNSYGIEHHFKMLFDLLVTLDGIEDDVYACLDIMSPDFLNKINAMDSSTEKDHSDILEKIAALYGVTRDFDVPYELDTPYFMANIATLRQIMTSQYPYTNTTSINFTSNGRTFTAIKTTGHLDETDPDQTYFVGEMYYVNGSTETLIYTCYRKKIDNWNSTYFNESFTDSGYMAIYPDDTSITTLSRFTKVTTGQKPLHLNNAELLTLIKARIIQQNYDGTFKMAQAFYDSVNLPIKLYRSRDTHVTAYLSVSEDSLSDNFVEMFKNGLFIIESMGIIYKTSVIPDLTTTLVFDSPNIQRYWDVGTWF